jgi:general L-amino acid transport system permease protein
MMDTFLSQKPPDRPSWFVRLWTCEPRALIVQAALLMTIAGFIAFLGMNLAANVARLNIALDFGFLGRPAGFEIAQTPIAYSEGATYFRAFLVALINTILVAVGSIVFATIIGFIVAMARLSSNPLLSSLALAYVEAVRNIPLLLQLFFWYFAALGPLPLPRQSLTFLDLVFLNKRGLSVPAPIAEPSFLGFAVVASVALLASLFLFRQALRHRIKTGQTSYRLWTAGAACLLVPIAAVMILGSPISWDVPRLEGFNVNGGIAIIPEFLAMVIGMSVYGGAFVAELIRGGIASIGRGQVEAGLALGLPRRLIYSKIVIPQALRAIVPPLSAQYINLVKTSSLASAIGYPDLMLIFAGTALNQTGQPLQIMAMTMGSYLVLCLITSATGNFVNRRIQLVER